MNVAKWTLPHALWCQCSGTTTFNSTKTKHSTMVCPDSYQCHKNEMRFYPNDKNTTQRRRMSARSCHSHTSTKVLQCFFFHDSKEITNWRQWRRFKNLSLLCRKTGAPCRWVFKPIAVGNNIEDNHLSQTHLFLEKKTVKKKSTVNHLEINTKRKKTMEQLRKSPIEM